jgi:hypothetical protein
MQVLETYRSMTADAPDSISCLEFDDHHDDYRLVYAIGINR